MALREDQQTKMSHAEILAKKIRLPWEEVEGRVPYLETYMDSILPQKFGERVTGCLMFYRVDHDLPVVRIVSKRREGSKETIVRSDFTVNFDTGQVLELKRDEAEPIDYDKPVKRGSVTIQEMAELFKKDTLAKSETFPREELERWLEEAAQDSGSWDDLKFE